MKKLKNKAFTLIELLVVVAIIGILAAVGVNTFGGFQDKAKINATKAIHKNTQKKIAAEVVKCSLGDLNIFSTAVTCASTPAGTASAIKTALGSGNASLFSDKNSWSSTSALAVKSGTTHELGFTNLAVSGATITLKTCTKTACASADQLTDNILVE